MAKLSDLVIDLAAVLRIDRTTVNTYARHLREAGMLSQAGRGVNAAQATTMDVSRLLIAMSVPAQAKDAPQTVRDFGRLVCIDVREDAEKPALTVGRLLHLPPRMTLEAAVAGLVSIFADDETFAIFDEAGSERYLPHVAARIDCTTRAATIWIGPHQYIFHDPLSEQIIELTNNAMRPGASDYDLQQMNEAYDREQVLNNRYFRGIRQTSTISGVEFQPIGMMLAGHREPGHVETDEEKAAALAEELSANAVRQSAITAPGASAPGQTEDEA